MLASYSIKENDKVRCLLCPHHCLLSNGQTGICKVRRNTGGVLYSENYGLLSAINVDPIEKKPLYHFFPGKDILSIGSVGCNMRCIFCQNCEISQTSAEDYKWLKPYTVEQITTEAKSIKTNIGMAYTYNEPTVFFEFMLDTAKAIHSVGLKNVMVTNGFIEDKPLEQLLSVIDAFNVDLKAFNDNFYKKHTSSKLDPVLKSLIQIRKAQKHLEITNLVIPGLNDSISEFKAMVEWISNTLGKQTILHLSKYFPRYKLSTPSTSDSLLIDYYEIAKMHLNFVYVGNVNGNVNSSNTECPNCKTIVIKRFGYQTDALGISNNGDCKNCGNNIVVSH